MKKKNKRKDLVFRGTSDWFQGNDVAQELSITSTTCHFFIAYLFAKESERYGKPVILVFDRNKFPKNIITLSNVFESDEQECALKVKPLDAFSLAEKIIRLEKVREIIDKLGIEVEDYAEKTHNRYIVKKKIERKLMNQIIKMIYEI